MTAFNADLPTSAGTVTTERSGAASGTDTVPAGCTLVVRNTGAGTHVLTLTIGYQFDGLAVPSRTISIAASAIDLIRVPASYGDANGRVGFSSDGTATEIKYYVVAA